VDATIVPSSGTKSYTLTTLTPLNSPNGGYFYLNGIANGVNDGTSMHMGNVIGSYFVDDALTGFIESFYPNPSVTILPNSPEVYQWVTPTGINNLGQVVGYYQQDFDPNAPNIPNYGGNKFSGFLYNKGAASLITLPAPSDAYVTLAYSINDAGWIAGVYFDTNFTSHCLLYKPPYNAPISFDFIGGIANCSDLSAFKGIFDPGYYTLSINGLGQIAGTVETTGGSSGVAFVDDIEGDEPGASNAATVVIPAAANSFYFVTGLNNNGLVAGDFECPLAGFSAGGPPCTLSGYAFLVDQNGVMAPFVGMGFNGINDEVQMTDGNITIDSQH